MPTQTHRDRECEQCGAGASWRGFDAQERGMVTGIRATTQDQEAAQVAPATQDFLYGGVCGGAASLN